MICCPMLGAFATNFFHVVGLLSLWRSTIPPHHTEPCAGIATHTRFTFAATPNPGTFSVKNGGSTAGEPPGDFEPHAFEADVHDLRRHAVDRRHQFRHELARRASRRPAFGERQGDRQQEVSRVTGRSIHVASRGTSSIASFGSPTSDQRTVRAEGLDDARQVGLGDQRHVGDQRFDRRASSGRGRRRRC